MAASQDVATGASTAVEQKADESSTAIERKARGRELPLTLRLTSSRTHIRSRCRRDAGCLKEGST